MKSGERGNKKMKKIVIATIILAITFTGLYAQTETDPASTGAVTAQQKLKEISVSKMEDAGFWYGVFPADNGQACKGNIKDFQRP